MPFDKVRLADMMAANDEYIDIDEIARRLGVVKRTVERLLEVYARKLKKSRRRQGRKFLYHWADILWYAKVHSGVEKENIPAIRNKRQNTNEQLKEKIKEITDMLKRLEDKHEALRQEQNAGHIDEEPPF